MKSRIGLRDIGIERMRLLKEVKSNCYVDILVDKQDRVYYAIAPEYKTRFLTPNYGHLPDKIRKVRIDNALKKLSIRGGLLFFITMYKSGVV